LYRQTFGPGHFDPTGLQRQLVDVAAGAIEHVGERDHELRRRLVSLDGDGVESIPYLNANSIWLSRSVGEAVPYASRS
jgi:hypothetical protein